MQYYTPKILIIFIIVAAIAASTAMPMTGVFSARIQYVLFDHGHVDHDDWVQRRNEAVYTWLLFLVLMGCVIALERILIGIGGENFTLNVRKLLIRQVLHKQLSWFDRQTRAPGVLTAIFAEDISQLNGMTTETIIVMLEACMIMLIGIVIGCFYSWEVVGISLLCSPFMFVGYWATAKISSKGTKVEQDSYANANALLSEVVLNYKTVKAFGDKNTEYIFDRYCSLMEAPKQANIKKAHWSGLFFGYSLTSRVFYIATVFYFSTLVYKYRDYTAEQIFSATNILLMASAATGMSAANVPSMAKAAASAQKVFNIIDEKSTLDAREGKDKKVQNVGKGDIQFKKVDFKYPSRSDKILNKLDLHIPAQ